MTPPVTSLATKRRSSAMAVPKDLSAPMASTFMVSLPFAAKVLFRQSVPEAVEIDALAACDQALDVGAAEIEMPEEGAFHDLIPISDARKGSVHGYPARDALGILGGEGIADHVADVVGHEIGLFDAEAVEHAGDVAGLGFLVIASFRVGGEAHAAQVWDDDHVVFRELRRQGRPHISGVGKTVQHDDGWPRATETHVDGGATGLDVL